MVWDICITKEAKIDYRKLDGSVRRQVLAGIIKVSEAPLPSPDGYGKPLGNFNGIKKASGKLIVIDNADALLYKETRKYITFDSNNQYIIIGRDVSNLLATEDNLYEMENSDEGARTVLRLRRYC